MFLGFFFLISISSSHGGEKFEKEELSHGLGRSAAAWGDYTNNGYLDLVTIGRDSDGNRRTLLYENREGELKEAAHGIKALDLGSEHFGGVVWADINNSGRLDLILAGMDEERERNVLIYENRMGDFSSFGKQELTEPDERVSALALADFNNNGLLDLAVGTMNNDEPPMIYENRGGEFSLSEVQLEFGVGVNDMIWADLNNSGWPDLIVIGQGPDPERNPKTVIYENRGGSSFVEHVSGEGKPIEEGFVLGSIAAGDYNNNGWIDLAISGECLEVDSLLPSTATVIYTNMSGDSSQEGIKFSSSTLDVGVYNSSLAFGDYSNNGYLDLALCGITHDDKDDEKSEIYMRVYKGPDFEEYEESIESMNFGLQRGGAVWGDMDNSEFPDLAVLGEDHVDSDEADRKAFILRNTGDGSGFAPAAVSTSTMVSHYSDGKLYLMWDKPEGMGEHEDYYYNFRVGTSEGTDDIVPSRYGSPLMGNYITKATTSTFVDEYKDQVPGLSERDYVRVFEVSGNNYVWAIQSIDASLGRSWSDYEVDSGWSEEQVFIDETPPEGYPGKPNVPGEHIYEREIVFTLDKGSAEDPETGIYGAYIEVMEKDDRGERVVQEKELSERGARKVWRDGRAEYSFTGEYNKTYRLRCKARHGYGISLPTSTYLEGKPDGMSEDEWRWNPDSLHYTSEGPNEGWSEWSDPVTPVELTSTRNNFITVPGEQETEVAVFAKSSGNAKIRVFDIMGGHVVTLLDEKIPAGNKVVGWDATDKNGSVVASGVYYINIQFAGEENTEKVVVVK